MTREEKNTVIRCVLNDLPITYPKKEKPMKTLQEVMTAPLYGEITHVPAVNNQPHGEFMNEPYFVRNTLEAAEKSARNVSEQYTPDTIWLVELKIVRVVKVLKIKRLAPPVPVTPLTEITEELPAPALCPQCDEDRETDNTGATNGRRNP